MDELTYSHPSPDGEEFFQETITNIKQINVLALPKEVERLPKDGNPHFYKHQILAGLMAQIVDFLYFYHTPGTGKTGVGINIGERLRNARHLPPWDAYLRGSQCHIRKMVIVVPSPLVEAEWKGHYHYYSNLKRFPAFYEVHHFHAFYNQRIAPARQTIDPERRKKLTAELITDYSNAAFYFDEAHTYTNRSNEDKASRELLVGWTWFLNILYNVKVFPASGTPIVMSGDELADQLNLMPRYLRPRPPNNETIDRAMEMPTDKDFWARIAKMPIEKATEVLRPYLNGVISHVKNKQQMATIVWPPESVELKVKDAHEYMKIVPVVMTPAQEAYYREIATSADKRENSFNTRLFEASIYGARELPTAAGLTGKVTTEESGLSVQDRMERVACKLPKILAIVNARPGIKFIITDWVKKGVDVITTYLASIKDRNGQSLFSEYPGKGKRGSPSLPGTKARRYTIIGKGSQEGQGRKIIDAVINNPLNLYGEYVEIVITSRIGMIAISLHNVQTYIVMDPAKQTSNELQRRSRFLRPESHKDLFMRNGTGAPIDVHAYYLAAVPADPKIESVDLNSYRDNLIKDAPNQKIRTVLWRIAYDAQLNALRNKSNAQTNEPASDYSFSDPIAQGPVDEHTYNLFGEGDEVKLYIDQLLVELAENYYVDMDEFAERHKLDEKSDRLIFFTVVNRYLRNETGLLTADGKTVYLKASGNGVYIQDQRLLIPKRAVPEGSSESSTETSLNLPSTAIYTNPHVSLTFGTPMLEKLVPIEKKYPQLVSDKGLLAGVIDFLDNPSIKGKEETAVPKKIALIEDILLLGRKGTNIELFDYLYERYHGAYIFRLRKPITRIKVLATMMPQQQINETVVASALKNELYGESVLIHTFWAQKHRTNNTAYGLFTDHSRGRAIAILDEQEGVFTMLPRGSAEQLVYGSIVSAQIMTPYEEFVERMDEKGPAGAIWGVIFDPENVFRIHDRRTKDREKTAMADSKMGKNMEARLRTYKTYGLPEYFDFFVYLDIPHLISTDERWAEMSKADLTLPKKTVEPKSGMDWLELLRRHLPEDSPHRKALLKVMEIRKSYYEQQTPEIVEKGKMMYRLMTIDDNTLKSLEINKEYLSQRLRAHLENEGQFYYFSNIKPSKAMSKEESRPSSTTVTPRTTAAKKSAARQPKAKVSAKKTTAQSAAASVAAAAPVTAPAAAKKPAARKKPAAAVTTATTAAVTPSPPGTTSTAKRAAKQTTPIKATSKQQ